ncbi:MAG: hypothetical protein ACMXYE_04040 [Candidatus Woesearchaeota archaeon]
MATTIQIPTELKHALDELRDKNTKSYAQLLQELVQKEKQHREQLLLKEYAQTYGKQSQKEISEWKNSETGWNF